MKIKDRLSLYFSLITSCLLLLVMGVIYLAFRESMKHDFFKRLEERNAIVAGLYLEADEVSPLVLAGIRNKLLQKIPREVYRIYNEKGDAVFVPDPGHYWSRPLIQEVLDKEYLEFSEGRRQVTGKLYHDNQGSFVVMCSAPDEGTLQRLNKLLKIMLVVFIAVVLITFYSGRLLSERLLSPIDQLITKMKAIGANNLHMRVETEGEKDEIGVLAANFNSLLERLEQSFTLQSTFVANVTHELRTPVTSIIGETEVALKHDRSGDEYRDILRSILADSVRLKETISGMLELAQINADFAQAPLTYVRLDELIWELNDYWINIAGPGFLGLHFPELPEDESALTVTANKQLLYIALNNIIGNAFKFSGGKKVDCTLRLISGLLKIEVRDQGRGISPDDFHKVMAPFYRSDVTSEFAGTGMGLFIANRIIMSFKGRLEIIESSNSGTTICVSLPASNSKQAL